MPWKNFLEMDLLMVFPFITERFIQKTLSHIMLFTVCRDDFSRHKIIQTLHKLMQKGFF